MLYFFKVLESHNNDINVVWAQNSDVVNKVFTLEKKALGILTFHSSFLDVYYKQKFE